MIKTIDRSVLFNRLDNKSRRALSNERDVGVGDGRAGKSGCCSSPQVNPGQPFTLGKAEWQKHGASLRRR
jgi:hypothetical protein